MFRFQKEKRKRVFSCTYQHQQDLMYDRFSDTFSLAFENGFGIYDGITGEKCTLCQTPYNETKFISTLNTANVVAIVPKTEVAVHLWRQTQKTLLCVIQIRERTRITGIYVRPDCICVISSNSVSIINLFNQTAISSLMTTSNPYGAFDISENYAQYLSTILTNHEGCFTFYSYVDPEIRFKEIQAFNKSINILKLSPNGNLVAVGSLGNKKLKCYSVPDGDESMTIQLPMSEEGAVSIQFDRYYSSLFIVTPSNILYIYDIETIDLNSKIDPSITLHYVAYFYLPDHEYFWAFYASKVNTIILVSLSGFHYKLAYNKKKKSVEIVSKTKLDFDVKNLDDF